MTKIKDWIAIFIVFTLVVASVVFAFTGPAKSEECLSASQMEEDYNRYVKDNPQNKDRVHYYRFTGDDAHTIRDYANENYSAELKPIESIVLVYSDDQEKGLVTVYDDDTINSCATKVIKPATWSIKQVLNYLQGV